MTRSVEAIEALRAELRQDLEFVQDAPGTRESALCK